MKKDVALDARKIVRIAFLVTVGLALFVLETAVPRPLPWLRVGLANSATLLALFLLGVREAFVVALVRSVLGSFIVGGLFNPSFVFSFFGGLASVSVMAIVYAYFRGIFSVVGISVWGAFVHNIVQLTMALFLFVRRWELLFLLPYFVFSTVATGFLTGILIFFLLKRIAGAEHVRVPFSGAEIEEDQFV
ncbi:MAG: Gx transporter family protein [Gemmatimonadota bacterium]|nr:MAG: Gx transporter family protein [Gemmatimonadota bacterium]